MFPRRGSSSRAALLKVEARREAPSAVGAVLAALAELGRRLPPGQGVAAMAPQLSL